MATGVEVLGAVAAALQLLRFAGRAVDLFFDISHGYKDANGRAAEILSELAVFRDSALFAYKNLQRSRRDTPRLKQYLENYTDTIQQLGRVMQRIRQKRGWGSRVKRWMKLMKHDGEVNILRLRLREHRRDMLDQFNADVLVDVRDRVDTVHAMLQRNHEDMVFRHRASQQSLQRQLERIEAYSVQSITTLSITSAGLSDSCLFASRSEDESDNPARRDSLGHDADTAGDHNRRCRRGYLCLGRLRDGRFGSRVGAECDRPDCDAWYSTPVHPHRYVRPAGTRRNEEPPTWHRESRRGARSSSHSGDSSWDVATSKGIRHTYHDMDGKSIRSTWSFRPARNLEQHHNERPDSTPSEHYVEDRASLER